VNTISDLWNGRFGLTKTYWLWGILSGIPWGIALSLVTPGSNIAIFLLPAFFAYCVIVHVGIWRAASEYKGAKAWAILAKIAVAITPACLVIGTLAAVIIPAMHQPQPGMQLEKPIHPHTQEGSSSNNHKEITSNANKSPPAEDTRKIAAEEQIQSNTRPTFQSEDEVRMWGENQLSTKLTEREIDLAHRYAKIWQSRIIYDINQDSIESLYIGYKVIIFNLLVNGLCQPQSGASGAISRSESGNIRFGAMKCIAIEYTR
jgi:hypothetical protein